MSHRTTRPPTACLSLAVRILGVGAVLCSSAQALDGPSPPTPALPEILVIGATPVPGLRVDADKVPGNVQSLFSADLAKNGAADLIGAMNTQLGSVNINDTLASIVDGIHLFKGVSDTTMIHGQGWQFIRLGRYLERAYATATLLEVYQPDLFQLQERDHSGYQYLELVGLLRCCTSFEAYCQVYTADLSPDRILEFLLLNRDFPHAILYCVDGIRNSIEAIQRTGGRRSPEELISVVGRLHAQLGYTSINEILHGDTAGFLHTIRAQALTIHELIYRYYVHYSIQSALAV